MITHLDLDKAKQATLEKYKSLDPYARRVMLALALMPPVPVVVKARPPVVRKAKH